MLSLINPPLITSSLKLAYFLTRGFPVLESGIVIVISLVVLSLVINPFGSLLLFSPKICSAETLKIELSKRLNKTFFKASLFSLLTNPSINSPLLLVRLHTATFVFKFCSSVISIGGIMFKVSCPSRCNLKPFSELDDVN